MIIVDIQLIETRALNFSTCFEKPSNPKLRLDKSFPTRPIERKIYKSDWEIIVSLLVRLQRTERARGVMCEGGWVLSSLS